MFDFGIWGIEKLIGHLPDDIKVDVCMVPKDGMDSGLRAYAENLDYKKKAPKRFRITMPANSGNVPSLRRLAHEMVHVKQWYTGEMRDDYEAMTTFWAKSKKTFIRDETDPDALSYWDWPWEIEAHGREVGLVEQYVDAKGYRKRCWWWDLNDEV